MTVAFNLSSFLGNCILMALIWAVVLFFAMWFIRWLSCEDA